MNRVIVAAAAFGWVACSDPSGTADGGTLFDNPHITPETTLGCLNYEIIPVGGQTLFTFNLRNDGRAQLRVDDVRLQGDIRGHFELRGVVPMVAEARESVLIQVAYAPEVPGWDLVHVVVTHNAENFADGFEGVVFARAIPNGLDAGTTWDAGPKPPEARGPDGGETCP